MADARNKNENNVAGAWFVDASCIGCELCVGSAPHTFTLDDDGLAYVHTQPSDDDERAACEDARENCPVDAIGKD
ncbi:ferredoxin [Chitinivibrio alkaliphilus]|uniref:Ferredoxin n=1 Tax=Chitinivibrio alkaliphilus ACht1 TaxID=1313304 RepID=U7D5A1_9BACT|nr:ferredoxin [Chitinivibrio alkaliphilus]ERP31123.1 ferredoxin [Chitinivibrio alkaliphilus ACht1]